ncbi:MAG: bifunctional folylpolyglutamate synthase/dihydrofolate synthase [Bacteroidales bacterium]|jgi:dihydrofolate synthase/folylpolyglutamate synthase|nr:bifunctional folylpolyglutamate synthase/dihydrofolate synthase [Bacteroidales bacterium]
MNYQETLNWLFNQLPMYQRDGKAAYKDDLNNTLELDNYFNHPHKKFKSIHVAGTNGKGSVSHMLASVLQESGYKVGLYTSPHLKDFKERIKINGQMISEDFVVQFVNDHHKIFEEIKPSFFEMTVSMAFDYFATENIDVAVVEVGMGGRLDSTNIIQPDISIITNIGLDHTAFLGNSLSEIAKEKAGIIKKCIPIVIGETHSETESIFRNFAKEKTSEIYFADEYFSSDYGMLSTDNKQVLNIKQNDKIIYQDLKLDLLGIYQKKNLLTVLRSVDLLIENEYKISNATIYKGLENVSKNTGLQGRWQILSYNPTIVCDTAHNLDGITMVVNQIQQTPYKNLHVVFGMVDDKNIDSILNILPGNATYYFAKANIPRALDQKILKKKANNFGLLGNEYKNVEEALKNAQKNADVNDLIFIGGSTFVVAEVV